VRLGAVEEVAGGGSLPPALGLFASSHPNVKLEVQIGVSSPLIGELDAGRLDVVFAKRPLGTSRGRLVWREPMVWAAAETFELVAGAALPLALYREHSVSRDAALIALRERELAWRSTRRRGPTRPPRHWLRFCSRLLRDHHARRSEMNRHFNRRESAVGQSRQSRASSKSGHVCCATESGSKVIILGAMP
jgi:DNA-binding transcriptional LysR family regulator